MFAKNAIIKNKETLKICQVSIEMFGGIHFCRK